MKEKIRYFNVVQIVGNILLPITIVFIFMTKQKITYDLYWSLITFLLLGNVFFIGKWGKRGQMIDNRKSKEIARSLDDTTTVMLVFYALVYLGIFFAQDFDKTLRSNLYVILGIYLFTIIFELFVYLVVNKAYDDTKKLIKSTLNKK